MDRLTLKEWQLQLGIRLNNVKGFRKPNNKIKTRLYTKEQFRRGIQTSNITVMTEKGMEFLENYTKGLDKKFAARK